MTYENKFNYEKTCMPKCPKNVNIKNIGGIIPGLTLPIKKINVMEYVFLKLIQLSSFYSKMNL